MPLPSASSGYSRRWGSNGSPRGREPIQRSDLSGNEPDGTPEANFAPQAGRVVVVGQEPLPEMVSGTNGQPVLVLYEKPTTGYTVEWRTNLLVGVWQPVLTNLSVSTNLFLQFSPPPGSGPMNFYRAKRTGLVLAEKVLSLANVDGANVFLDFSSVAGRTYRVQFTPTPALANDRDNHGRPRRPL